METIPTETTTETSILPIPTQPCYRENGSATEVWIPDTGLGRVIGAWLRLDGWEPIRTHQEYQTISPAAMAILLARFSAPDELLLTSAA